MSEIRVDKIVNASGSGAVEFSQGISLPTGQTLSGIAQTAESLTATANINTTGIITAASFSGGGLDIAGHTELDNLNVSGVSTFQNNVTISGNLTVDGTTTSIDTVNLVVEDKNIGIGSTSTPSNSTADGGGFTLFGGIDGDKTLTWQNSSTAWTSNQDFNLTTGRQYEINGSAVLSSSQVLGKSVPSGTIVGDTDSQTLSSKTLCSATLTGSLTAGGGTGSNGQFLQSTGSGVQWATSSGGAIAGCCVSNFLSCNTCAPNISGGANNFLLGCNAGLCLTSGSNNFFAGLCAGAAGSSASNNIFLGLYAGQCTTGIYNIFFGKHAGRCTVGGTRNIFIGSYVGEKNTTGSCNVFNGFRTGGCNTCGRLNTFVGAYSANSNVSGCYNTFIGSNAGNYNQRGNCNVFVGRSSGYNITGGCNVVIGSFTGTGFTACTNHIFLSDGAGTNRAQFNGSGAFGLNGSNYGTAGQVLTSCGNAAAPQWTTVSGGSGAIAGCCTSNFLSCNTCAPNIDTKSPASNNFFVGCNAGVCVTSGSNNFFAGLCAGQVNTTGCHNTFIGDQAGFCNVTGSHNIFIGSSAGRVSTGSKNIFLGCCSGCSMTTGSNNVIFGGFCGCVSFGGLSMLTCSNHVAIADGQGCLKVVFNNCGAAAFGGGGNQYGAYGCFLQSNGSSSAPFWSSIPSTLVICNNDSFLTCNLTTDFQALGTTNLRHSFFAGVCAGRYSGGANTSCHNTFIGQNAGFSNCGQYECFGQPAACATGSYNIAIGRNSLYSNNFGSYNTALGMNAGCGNITGCNNVYIGKSAGASATRGNYNNFFGYRVASCSINGATGSHNNIMGTDAGFFLESGSDNNFFGHFAGYCNTTGCDNIFIGQCAGYVNTTGCNNIAIGCLSGNDGLYDFGTTGGSNIIVMGNNSHSAAYVKVAWTTGSDARDKTNIIPIPVGKDFLKQLDPVQYQWADRETGEVTVEKPNYGFLAQDILALENPPLVLVDDHDPEHLKLRESMIVPVLVKTVQELIEEVDALKEEVRILKGE